MPEISYEYAKDLVKQIICSVAPIDVSAFHNVVFLVIAAKPSELRLAIERLEGKKVPFLTTKIDFETYKIIPDFRIWFFGAYSNILERILKALEAEGFIEVNDEKIIPKDKCPLAEEWIKKRLEVLRGIEPTKENAEKLAMPFLGYYDAFGKGMAFGNYVLDMIIAQITMLYSFEQLKDEL